MKRALVFQHMDHDHPGRFLDYFAEDGIIPEPVRLFEGQAIPDLAPYDFLFVLGGSQDTWQEDQHPWLAAEKQAIREWVMERAKPYFGVCLGHQLLATALGGEVAPADEGEVGVFDVTLTEEAKSHRLMQGLEPTPQGDAVAHGGGEARAARARACLPPRRSLRCRRWRWAIMP